jgi:hypothetical protein
MVTLVVVLLLMTGCSEFPETKFTRGAIVQANVTTDMPGQNQPAIIKSQSSLPSVKLHSSFLILELGETSIVITDKDNRTHILSRALLYNDRFVSDVEAQVYEALRLMEGTESETDSVVQLPMTAMN